MRRYQGPVIMLAELCPRKVLSQRRYTIYVPQTELGDYAIISLDVSLSGRAVRGASQLKVGITNSGGFAHSARARGTGLGPDSRRGSWGTGFLLVPF